MPVDKFGRMSDAKTRDTGVSLTYINNNYVRSDGGTTVSGSIDMRGNTLYNLADPVNPQYVATKEYADNNRSHIIAAHASYSGPLIMNEHQFTFGGNELHNPVTVFLVPQSGRIRKIKMKIPSNKNGLEDRLIERNKIDTRFASYGFFSFIRIRDGEYDVIGIIRCQEVYKTYYQGIMVRGPNPEDREPFIVKFAYDFCFEDDLAINPLLPGEEGDGNEYVREGDILNIRTNINLEYPPTLSYSPYSGEDAYTGNTFYCTFLIELDPLYMTF